MRELVNIFKPSKAFWPKQKSLWPLWFSLSIQTWVPTRSPLRSPRSEWPKRFLLSTNFFPPCAVSPELLFAELQEGLQRPRGHQGWIPPNSVIGRAQKYRLTCNFSKQSKHTERSLHIARSKYSPRILENAPVRLLPILSGLLLCIGIRNILRQLDPGCSAHLGRLRRIFSPCRSFLPVDRVLFQRLISGTCNVGIEKIHLGHRYAAVFKFSPNETLGSVRGPILTEVPKLRDVSAFLGLIPRHAASSLWSLVPRKDGFVITARRFRCGGVLGFARAAREAQGWSLG